ncbi:RluA family pseudouridine synthase [Mycoplasma sp. 1018B]|uniref:pseudouridine synthase n=1 Tax=Mycoplasma sp. 1018B TaxID=2967302 RepID=UPI00211CD1D0|nr:RluA family pseudouridine synthase [Mycoplasma sp. 1018B]UUM19315.1 RluA family pseudouridine synthase [Mycoplasma sp. 1018B]
MNKQSNWKKYIVTLNNDEKKLLNYLKEIFSNYPLNLIYKIIRKKDVKINGKRTNNEKQKIYFNDIIEIYFPEEIKNKQKLNFKNISIDFNIIYEDNNILIVDKPKGISMHSDANNLDLQVLKYLDYNDKNNNEFKPSHIGRLDKETSGICLYAKNYYSLAELNKKTKFFDKIYTFKSDYNGPDREINLFIWNNKNNYLEAKETSDKNLTTAKTYIYRKNKIWYAKILTGKKHQIRLSLKTIGFPILGDKKYSGKLSDRLYLHCKTIIFHNLDGKLKYLNKKEFNSKVPWKETNEKHWKK